MKHLRLKFKPKFSYFSFLFLLFFSPSAFAVELKLESESFNSEKLNFSIASFIDARINTVKYIGFTKLGIKNTPEALTLPANFEAYCNSFFKQTSIFQGKQLFIAVINQVTVQELVFKGTEYSDVCVAIDYYAVDPDGKGCKLFHRTNGRAVVDAAIDITKKHSKNLSHAFLSSLLNLNEFISSKKVPGNYALTSVGSLKDSVRKNIVANKDTVLKEGVYYSTKQLLLNQPDALPGYLENVDTTRLENNYFEEDILPLSLCYAFVKNKTLYVRVRTTVYHKAVMVHAAKQVRILDVNNKKSALKTPGHINMFGIVGDIVTLIANETSGKQVKDLNIDLETGLMIN